MIFTDLELAYLADQPLGRLATVQRSGQPQASPVSFAWNERLSVIEIPGFRMAKSQKFRNLAANDRVAFVVDDVVSTNPWTVRCLEVRGRAEALGQPDDAVVSLGDGAIIRIHPARVISWGIDPDASSPRNVAELSRDTREVTFQPSRRQVLLATGAGLLATGLTACTRAKTADGSGSPTAPPPSTPPPSPPPSSPGPSTPSPKPTYAQLAAQLSGGLVLAGAAGYNASTLLYNPRFNTQPQPAAIAHCASAADVAACVQFAADGGAPLRLRNGGHSYGGWSSSGGLVADLSALKTITIDSTAKTAKVGAGALLVDVYTQLAARNVSIGGGSCATVGITGLTLGGGQGVLSRAYGLTCDQLASVDIVTADGKQRTVDADTDADLFWALRGGGGGSFGAVTALTFNVKPAPTVTTFYLEWPWTSAATVLSVWQNWITSIPRELWTTCKLLADPGQGLSVSVSGTWIGSGSPNSVLQSLLKATPAPTENDHHTASYGQTMLSEAGCAGEDVNTCVTQAFAPAKRQPFSATSSVLAKPLPSAGVEAIVHAVANGMNVAGMVEGGASFDALGGAVADGGASDSSFPWRSALAIVQYTATWPYAQAGANPAAFDGFVRGLRSTLSPWLGTSAYVNYADASIADFAAAYWGPNAARLSQVKGVYDPGDVFSYPQSVPRP